LAVRNAAPPAQSTDESAARGIAIEAAPPQPESAPPAARGQRAPFAL